VNHKHKTLLIKKEQAHTLRKWYLFDATGKTLGRFASEIAKVLRGKHKVDYTPNVDTGDGVIVINADKINVSGMKEARKVYRYHTGWIGGLREIPYRVMMEKKPEYIMMHAVRKMVPRTKLGKHQMKKLRIFKNEKHGMEAQKPIPIEV
jgi:large subunit ribosomal protein L13